MPFNDNGRVIGSPHTIISQGQSLLAFNRGGQVVGASPINQYFTLIDALLPPNAESIIAVPTQLIVRQVTIMGDATLEVIGEENYSLGELREGLMLLPNWKIKVVVGEEKLHKIYIFCEQFFLLN